jgi:hypothetical protein
MWAMIRALIAYAAVFLALLAVSLGTFFGTRGMNILMRFAIAVVSTFLTLFAILLALRVLLR